MENNYNLNLDQLTELKVVNEKLSKKHKNISQKAYEKENEKLKMKKELYELKLK